MKIDSLFVYALVQEMSYLKEGARIEKIHQPTQYEVVFHLRTKTGNKKFLMSIHPETFRMHETQRSYENPKTPKAFCVVLRKYIEGGKITEIEQIENDRLIKITIETYDAVGNFVKRYLYLELMGKHSNLVLVNADQIIIDALKRVDIRKSEYRETLPKLPYVLPRAQILEPDAFKYYINPNFRKWLELKKYAPEVLLLHAAEPAGYYYKNTITGKVVISFTSIIDIFDVDITEVRVLPTLSEALDSYYHNLTTHQQLQEKVSALLQFVDKHYKKNKRKKMKLEKELKSAENYEQYQKMGNLLYANLQIMSRQMSEVTVLNFFEPLTPEITITLKPLLTPTQNAQAYFKKYTKSKKAIEMLQQQIEKTETEIAYFETVLQSLELADLQQATEIRDELEMQGYLKVKKRKEQKQKKVKFMTFIYEGCTILVGRNNLQNEEVTFKQKRKGYTWLHVKDFPGSHVLIQSTVVDEKTLHAAALLAGYYSKMQTSENVAIDYTEVQNVHKPSGAKPGFVRYKEQKTVYITPSYQQLVDNFPSYQF
ncbi:hypothetical protein AwErysi_07410 [Erysipelotrichaceae bacterium]|nr:hypothetical protein AwErysi_07410 [Erysipelotrichaceae bacterium]